MVDQETKDVSAGPTGAPVNRDARREPEVIEGEIAARETHGSEPPPDPPAPESSTEPRPALAAAPRTGLRSLLAGAVGGLIVSVLGLGAGYTLLAPKDDVSETANRLSAIEAQARQENHAIPPRAAVRARPSPASRSGSARSRRSLGDQTRRTSTSAWRRR